MTYSVATDVLRAAALFMSTEKARYYMCGIHVDPTGRVVASDGHRMFVGPLCATDKAVGDFPATGFIIPADAVKRVLAGNKRAFINFTESKIDGLDYTPVDGTFPDWTRGVPSQCSGEVAQFNLAYLGDFGKAAKSLGAVAHVHHNGTGPAAITFPVRADCFGVVMPLRPDDTPDWKSLL